jgi:hypothetical protein
MSVVADVLSIGSHDVGVIERMRENELNRKKE